MCKNSVGSYTCKCRNGYGRKGEKCIKGHKGKKEKKKSQEEDLEEGIRQGKYFSEFDMKIGSLLYAVFFALVFLAIKKSSRIMLMVLTLIYACVLYYLRAHS